MYQNFEQLLNEKGLTIYRVAKDTGISTSTLYDWRDGKTRPKLDKLQVIATYFGVSFDQFAGIKMNSEEMNKNI